MQNIWVGMELQSFLTAPLSCCSPLGMIFLPVREKGVTARTLSIGKEQERSNMGFYKLTVLAEQFPMLSSVCSCPFLGGPGQNKADQEHLCTNQNQTNVTYVTQVNKNNFMACVLSSVLERFPRKWDTEQRNHPKHISILHF